MPETAKIIVHYFINMKISQKNETSCISIQCGDLTRLIFTFSYYGAKMHTTCRSKIPTLCKLLGTLNLNKHIYSCNPNKQGQPELLLHKLLNNRITTDLENRSIS